jgi:hypothetical protein
MTKAGSIAAQAITEDFDENSRHDDHGEAGEDRAAESAPIALRTAFAIEKLRWFDQIRLDRRLAPATVVVALAIGQRVNSRTREAWPCRRLSQPKSA